MSSGWIALIMLVVFIVVAGAFAWQERARLPGRSLIYGSEDAVRFVLDRLSPEAAERLGEGDVRRILEWELEYVQRLMAAGGDEPVVVAGYEAARHAQERLYEQGHRYDGALVVEVMELQADYLAAIGAIARPAEEHEIDELFGDDEQGAPGEGE